MAKKNSIETEVVWGLRVNKNVARGMRTIQKSFYSLNSSIDRVAKNAAIAGAAITAALGAAAIKVTKDCISAGAQFEKQMSNVATLLDGNVKGRVEELSAQILEVKRKTKKPIEDLTNGAYQIISAFGDAPDSAEKLEIAAKAAKAGVADTLDAVNLFSAQMKGYGDTSADFMRKCADMNFQVVKLGQTTFPELAAALPSVVPLAKTMGVTIQEVNGYMATMTGVTGNASEVTTQLASALTALLKPSKEMTKKINALGFADGQAMVKARGLQGSLEILRKTVKTDLEFGKLFGRKEGINFALAATGTLADTVRQKTKAMYEATGSTEAAFAKQGDNMIAKWTAISNAVEIAQIQIGQKLTPFLKTLAEKLLPHVENALNEVVAQVNVWVDEWSKWLAEVDFVKLKQDILNALGAAKDTIQTYIPIIKDWGEKILIAVAAIKACDLATRIYGGTMAIINGIKAAWFALVAVVGLTKMAVLGVANGMKALIFWHGWVKIATSLQAAWNVALFTAGLSVQKFGAAMKALAAWHGFVKIATALQWAWNIALNANPIGLIVLAVAALIGIGWLLYDNWDEICAGMKVAWDWLCKQLSALWEPVKSKLAAAWDWLSEKWDALMEKLGPAWEDFCRGIKVVWKVAKIALAIAWKNLSKKWDEVVGKIRTAWQNICTKVAAIWEPVKSKLAAAWDWLSEKWDEITGSIRTAWGWVCDKVTALWEPVKYGLAVAWGLLSGKWDENTGSIRSTWETVCNKVKELWEPVKNGLTTSWDTLSTKWDEITGGIRTAWETVCNKVSEKWNGVKDGILSSWESIKEAVRGAIDFMMEKIQPFIDAWEKVKGGVSGVISKIGSVFSGDDEVEKKARGGFTKGVSICGEAGTEAVISFDPAYRADNRRYVATAANLLGGFATFSGGGSSGGGRVASTPARNMTFGDIHISPVFNGASGVDRKSILRALEDCVPEVLDKLEEEMNARKLHRYA